ncbi:hypothetical protein JCM4914_34540 [Streptomyces platensis subsp. malvinus]
MAQLRLAAPGQRHPLEGIARWGGHAGTTVTEEVCRKQTSPDPYLSGDPCGSGRRGRRRQGESGAAVTQLVPRNAGEAPTHVSRCL